MLKRTVRQFEGSKLLIYYNVISFYKLQYSERVDSGLNSKVILDDSPNNNPYGYMTFGPQSLASTLYQLSPPEVCLLITMFVNSLGK